MNGYNFTDRVRKVLQMAREEAARLRHEYVGTEHILLAVIREGEGVAVAVLTNLNVDLEGICQEVEAIAKQGKAARTGDFELPYTSRAKKVLELAMSEAREMNHSYVGSEHLLLGVLREEKGIAAQVLTHAGVTLDLARAETLRLLGTEVPPEIPGYARPAQWHDEVQFVFSPSVSKVLRLARSAATTLRQNAIDTEHLLVALVGEDGQAVSLLRPVGTPIEEIAERLRAKRAVGTGDGRFDIPYSTNALQAIWQAVADALMLRHESVGSGHLLLGLLRVPGTAADVLAASGVTESQVREKLLQHPPQMGAP